MVGAERVALYGLTLVARRRVCYGRVDPATAHEVFLREALAADELASNAPFLAHNRQLIAEIADLEHKARRQDVLVDEEAIVAFYAERVPADIHSRRDSSAGASTPSRRTRRYCTMTREALMRHAASSITEEQYPECIDTGRHAVAVEVSFFARPSSTTD